MSSMRASEWENKETRIHMLNKQKRRKTMMGLDSLERDVWTTYSIYRVGHKSLATPCKSQSMSNRWITTICDLIRSRGKSLGGLTLTAAIL
jgi:hypothetical protein